MRTRSIRFIFGTSVFSLSSLYTSHASLKEMHPYRFVHARIKVFRKSIISSLKFNCAYFFCNVFSDNGFGYCFFPFYMFLSRYYIITFCRLRQGSLLALLAKTAVVGNISTLYFLSGSECFFISKHLPVSVFLCANVFNISIFF